MLRFIKNAMAAFALSGLVLSQPALAVRSADSLPGSGAKVAAQARVGTPIGHSENFAGNVALGWILGAVIAATVLVVVVHDNKNHNRSPG